MDLQLKGKAQEYRLLMIQPDPETGEKVCVGILFEDDVIYDARLSRLKCLSNTFDPSVARFYLNELRRSVRTSRGVDLQQIIIGYAPILTCSAPRFIANPVTQSTKAILLERFVTKDQGLQQQGANADVAARQHEFSSKLRAITTKQLEQSFDHVIENAKANEVLGRSYPTIGKVALALKRLDRTIVMDGVDLNSETYQKALTRSTRVVHTFWQYKRVSQKQVMRVAILFNGHSRETAIGRDTHDFVLEQFQSESDRTLEGSSVDISEQVAGLLQKS